MSPVAGHPQVFFIGGDRSERAPPSPEIGGNKAANLSQLDTLALRVPPAVVLGTAWCEAYFERGGQLEPDFPQQLRGHVRQLEDVTGLRSGGRDPLLVSVRSSPPVSMPVYENVLDDLEGNVRRILEFCGLDFEPACVEFHRTERNVRTASSEQVRQPIFRDGLFQWRNYEPWLGPLKDSLDDALIRYRE